MSRIKLTLFLVALQLLHITGTNAGIFAWLNSKVKEATVKVEGIGLPVNFYNLDDPKIRNKLVLNGLAVSVDAFYTLAISNNFT